MYDFIFLYIGINFTLYLDINIINLKTFRYLWNFLTKLIPTKYLLLSVDPWWFYLLFCLLLLLLLPCWCANGFFFKLRYTFFNHYSKKLKLASFIIHTLFLEVDAFFVFKVYSQKKIYNLYNIVVLNIQFNSNTGKVEEISKCSDLNRNHKHVSFSMCLLSYMSWLIQFSTRV